MLSLSQRLILGCLSLVAVVLVFGLAVRISLKRLTVIDAQFQTAANSDAAHWSAALRDAAQQHQAIASHIALLWILAILLGLAIAAATVFFVLLPLRQTAKTAQLIGQGDLQQRVEWRSRGDLGTIATEFNRLAVRLRDLRETESGRRQMEYQLSDAVVQ